MLGIEYKKAPPTVYVMHFVDGVPAKEGVGLSFWYFAPTATIIDVPVATLDAPFYFTETTADFQEVTVQGQLSYRIKDPARINQIIDFSVSASGGYLNEEDPQELLSQRLINEVQVAMRGQMQRMTLSQVLRSHVEIVDGAVEELRASDSLAMMGIEVISLSVTAIKPTPEMARALEAEAREGLQRKSDQAIYARRNAAVEEERRIKESELNTQISVETKNRQIRETKMAADIAVEQQRAELIDRRVENEKKDADSKAYTLSKSLEPFAGMDWKMVMALAAKNGDPRLAFSLAFQEMAQNAGKIGQLNLSPDLLTALTTAVKEKA